MTIAPISPPSDPRPSAPREPGQGPLPRRRVLFVNLDFQDVVYSHLWGRTLLAACAQAPPEFAVDLDMVAVNPFAGRDLAEELGVPPSALEAHIDGTAAYLDEPDAARSQSVIGQLLDQHRYQMLILNCDAALFTHLMVDRERDFADTLWMVYDRHLHIGLPPADQHRRLRDRVLASNIHLYTIQEIATGDDCPACPFGQCCAHPPSGRLPQHEAGPQSEGIIGSFKQLGFPAERIHLQQWPLDDDFFAPQPDAAPNDAFVVFSGGDSGRDYATLFEAIRGLPIQLRLCANSYPTPVPPNVTILPRLPLHRFRDEVARATVVVVPLTGQPLVSGITVIAMAKMMGKPVIASDNRVVRIHIRSQGDGGYLAQAGNAALLRSLLIGLIESPAELERLGREARTQAAADLSLRAFIERMGTDTRVHT